MWIVLILKRNTKPSNISISVCVNLAGTYNLVTSNLRQEHENQTITFVATLMLNVVDKTHRWKGFCNGA